MKSLGLEAIHFRILTIVRLCFSKVLGRYFRFKNCFTPRFSARKLERAVAFHSGQLRFRGAYIYIYIYIYITFGKVLNGKPEHI